MKHWVFFVLAFGLLGAAADAESFTGADGVSVEVAKLDRVVALNSATVEILRDLGLAGRIVGVENGGERVLRSDPRSAEAAAVVKNLGHPFNPDVAAIVALRPDLVISAEENLKPPAIEALRAANVPLLMLEHSARDGIDGLKRRVGTIARVFGAEEKGRALVEEIDARHAEAIDRVAGIADKRRVMFVYTHGPDGPLIYGRETGAHRLIELAGGVNAAEFAGAHRPLTAESVGEARPDAIIVRQRDLAGSAARDEVLNLPGVAASAAGRNGAVFGVSDNVRWVGPRIFDEAKKLYDALYPVALPQAGPPPENSGLSRDVRFYRDISYIGNGHERQKLDLYLPPADRVKPGERLPLVIWIHGGAFLYGDKGDRFRALPMLNNGYAVASLNYRLSQHAVFPALVQDVKAAVRWLRANAEACGIDPDRFVAWGESAGGYLCAMLGTTGDGTEFDTGPNLEYSSRLQGVVDFYGPTDFARMDEQDADIPDNVDHDAPDSPESKLLGGPVQENTDKSRLASPLTYVSAADPPFLILHGDRDPIVAYGQSLLLEEALRKAGVRVTLHTVKGGGHNDGFGEPEYRAAEAFTRETLRK